MVSRFPLSLVLAAVALATPVSLAVAASAGIGAWSLAIGAGNIAESPAQRVAQASPSTGTPAPDARSGWAPPIIGTDDGDPVAEPGVDEGLDNILNNLMDQLRPAIGQIGEGLDQAAGTIRPMLGDLTDLMDDMRNYLPPERLPNGDILIRRKADAPPPPEIGKSLRDLGQPPAESPESGSDSGAPAPPVRVPDGPQINL